MKRAVKLTLTGNLQSMFTRLYFKDQAKANKINGFFRNLDSGKVELFLEGQHEDVEKMIELCKQGPKFTQIRALDLKEERLQGFKEFKILSF